MITDKYLNIINKYGNGFFELPEKENSFEILLSIFDNINNVYDFQHFRRNFPPEWIYITSIRLNRKDIWVKIFGFIYDYHIKNDEIFPLEMMKKNINSKKDFIDLSEKSYSKIIKEGGLDYEEGNDLTVTFCNENILDIIRKYCTSQLINKFNENIVIHPIERKGSINKVLFYRSTFKNRYVDKMFDDYQEGKNTKRLAKDFLYYLDKLK